MKVRFKMHLNKLLKKEKEKNTDKSASLCKIFWLTEGFFVKLAAVKADLHGELVPAAGNIMTKHYFILFHF